ncbi:MAG: NEW3 domain-containing protein [Thermofilum sp.]
MSKARALPVIVALLVVLASALTSLSQPSTSAEAQGSVGVMGYVVSRDGKPVAGVEVIVYDSNNVVVASTSTSADGFFTVPLMPGTYTLKLSKQGYVEKSIAFTVSKTTYYTANLGTIVLDYALSVSLPITALQLSALGTATVPVTVSNKGPATENLTIELSGNCSLDVKLYSGSAPVNSLSLGPGETVSLTLKVKAPYMQPAVCSIFAMFSGSTTQVRNLLVSVVQQPLGLLSSQLEALKAAPGSVLQIPLKISNPLSDPVRAALEISTPPGWGAVVKDATGTIIAQLRLDSGAFTQATLMLSVPREASPGTYPITLTLRGVDPYFIEKLTINVTVASSTPALRLTTPTPFVNTYAGKTAQYQLSLSNLGDSDCVASVAVSGLPQGYTWALKDAQGNVVSQVYLPAGGSLNLYLAVSVPPLAEPGAVSFQVSVTAGSTGDSLGLSLGILGSYKLSYVTQNFYVEMLPGSTSTFQVTVRNDGYSSLTNVKLSVASAPSGFTASVSPQNVLLLKPGNTTTFTVSVTADPTVDAGDYYISLVLSADHVDAQSRDLHVFVKPPSTPAYYAVLAAALLLAGVVLAFRKFGRR